MVVEYIRHTLPSARAEEFEEAYQRAGRALDADPHCVRWQVARGAEEPEHFVVRIEWDSIEGHEHGFRSSPQFGEFLAAVRPFFDQIKEMKPTTRYGPAVRRDRPERRPWHALTLPLPQEGQTHD